jgi:hypothetical protein
LAIGLLSAVWTNHLLSHDSKSFFEGSGMQASANKPQDVPMISARKSFAAHAWKALVLTS